jgi:hypothetical protein
LRRRLADAFVELSRNFAVWKNDEVMNTFEEIVNKPEKYQDIVGERFCVALNAAMYYMLQDSNVPPRFLGKISDKVFRNASNSKLSDNSRAFFISVLCSIYEFRVNERKKIFQTASKTCFEENVKKGSETYENGKTILHKCLGAESKELRDMALRNLIAQESGKNPDSIAKARDILEPFIYTLGKKPDQPSAGHFF